MKVFVLRRISKFIDKLIRCGYNGNTDLEILLADMGYTDLPGNFANILTSARAYEHDIMPQLVGDSYFVRTVGNTITTTTNIKNLITICDELCITSLTNFIIWLNKPLPRTIDNHIINYDDRQCSAIYAYNMGYKVLHGAKYTCTSNQTALMHVLPNSIQNGLYIKDMSCRIITKHLVESLPITDIEKIDIDFWHGLRNDLIKLNYKTIKGMELRISAETSFDNGSCSAIRDIISLLPSLNFFEINGGDNLIKYPRYHKSQISTNVCRHTIKSLSFVFYAPNGIMNELFGKIRELSLSYCIVNQNDIIPDTVKRLNIIDTKIDDAAIGACTKIKYLNIMGTNSITTCAPFAKTLKHLVLLHTTTMGDAGLALCTNLKILYAMNNHSITTCTPFANSLVVLHADYNCGVGDDGLKMCSRLMTLHAYNNSKIRTCAPFARSLTSLGAGGNCGIDDDGLKLCSKLTMLDARDNPKITTCDPFANSLETLYASSCCGLGDDGLKLCTKLKCLNAAYNSKITTCAPFASMLTHLFAWSTDIGNECGITDEGIKLCTKLIKLSSDGNDNITLKLPIIYNGE